MAFARSTMGYALGRTVPTARERELGYRAHFERMGFTEELAELDRMREAGASRDEVAHAFPVEVLQKVGYYGPAGGGAAAFKQSGSGLGYSHCEGCRSAPGCGGRCSQRDAGLPAPIGVGHVDPPA